MSILQNPLGIHGTALILRSQRSTLLASNIANADTPNYKARDVDFSNAFSSAKLVAMRTSHQGHQSMGTNDTWQRIKYRVPVSPSLDGNTVETNVENSLFLENALRYEATNVFLNRRIKGIISALRGE